MRQIYKILWFLLFGIIIVTQIPIASSVSGILDQTVASDPIIAPSVSGILDQTVASDPIVAHRPRHHTPDPTDTQETTDIPDPTVTPHPTVIPHPTVTHHPTVILSKTPNKIVQVYYDDTFSSSYTNIRYDSVTDILWAFIRINEDGSLNYVDYGNPDGLISLAHSKGVRVILSVQETYGQANQFLEDPTARTNGINNLLNEVKTREFDGIDIDIETATSYQHDDMTSFVQELYNTFKESNPNYRVSIAVPVTDWNNVFDGSLIKNYVDYLMIMAYDVYGDNSYVSGPVAPMLVDNSESASVTTGIDYWKNTETIPTNKILLGIPYYGFDRSTVSSDRLSSTDGSVTWIYLDDIPKYNYDRYFDQVWKTPWQVWQENYYWHQLQYEDIESLSYKYDKVNSENLAGIGIWAINYGLNRADLSQLIIDKFAI